MKNFKKVLSILFVFYLFFNFSFDSVKACNSDKCIKITSSVLWGMAISIVLANFYMEMNLDKPVDAEKLEKYIKKECKLPKAKVWHIRKTKEKLKNDKLENFNCIHNARGNFKYNKNLDVMRESISIALLGPFFASYLIYNIKEILE